MGCYSIRKKNLRKLGYKKYKRYLKSKLWKNIRQLVLIRDKYQCQSCDNVATQVHHKVYSFATLSGKNLKGLVSICRRCHETIEFFSNGKKTDIKVANKRLLAIKRGKLLRRP